MLFFSFVPRGNHIDKHRDINFHPAILRNVISIVFSVLCPKDSFGVVQKNRMGLSNVKVCDTIPPKAALNSNSSAKYINFYFLIIM